MDVKSINKYIFTFVIVQVREDLPVLPLLSLSCIECPRTPIIHPYKHKWKRLHKY